MAARRAAGEVQDVGQADTLPLGHAAPSLHAVVLGDLDLAGHGLDVIQRQRQRLPDQPPDPPDASLPARPAAGGDTRRLLELGWSPFTQC